MANYFDREWRVRDAVLAWLGREAANGHKHPVLNAARVAEATSWEVEPPTEDEVAEASSWLKEEGFIKGPEAWGAGVIRPSILAKGERWLAAERSVQDDGTTVPAPAPFVVTITGNQGAAIAVNSPGAQQTVTNTDSFQAAREVAELVARAAAEAGGAVEAEGQALSGEIIEELDSPAPNRGRLRELLFKAGTAFAGTLGADAGAGLSQLALAAAAGIVL